MSRPPHLPTRVVARALRGDPAAAAILGDLHEDFVRILDARGPVAARCWYWREALGLALGRLVHGLLALFHARRRPQPTGAAPATSARHLGTLVEDGAYAVRTLRRSPGFCTFAAVVIGVGVAAVTTVFSVLKPLALALPFEDAHELVWISNEGEPGDSSLSAVTSRTTNLIDFRERTTSFRGITGYDAFFAGRPYTFTHVGESAAGESGAGGPGGGGPGVVEPERLVGVGVAHDFLDVLGVEPLHGRSFTREEGGEGGPAAVILSYGFWRTRFAAEAGIVGRTLMLNDIPRTVVGVLPPDFDFSSVFSPGVDVDFLLPVVVSRDNAFQGNVLHLIGRLREGVTPEAAQAELGALVAALQEEDPERWGLGAQVAPLQSHLAGPFRHSLLLLVAAAGTLLLLVCINVSSLILARSPARANEMAVRKALGAPRIRLMRQLVLESLAVALVGAAIGSLLAYLATRVVRNAAEIRIPLMDTVGVDASALAVAVGVAVLTGIAVGTIPALQIADRGEAGVLRAASGRSSASRGTRRLQETLVVAEVTLACVLLVIGGLLMASFRAVLAVDLGFEPANTVAWQLHPSIEFGSDLERLEESARIERRSEFYARLADRVEAEAGIESAGLIDALPLGRNRAWGFSVVGRPEEDTEEEVFPHVVDPGYLPTMAIPLLAGRNISRTDREDAPRVVLLNETGARRIFGGEREALRRRLAFWGPWEWEVVGVVGDVRHLSPETGPGIEVYFPLAQMPDFTTMDLVVRSRLPAAQVAAAVSGALEQVDPAMPTREFWSLDTTVRGATSDRRFAVGLLSAFGVCALLLAALGIYGVVSRTVAERKPEIGIRMALGASAADIVADVLRRMLLLTAAGIGAGWTLSLMVSRLLESVLFGVGAADPVAFLGTAMVLLAVAVLAAAVPAFRAASTEASLPLKAQ